MDLTELVQDRRIFESFLLVLFYNNLLIENPALDSMLFLFAEGYVGMAGQLALADEPACKKVVSSLRIDETALDGFFLELWHAGVFGDPFFEQKDISRLFSDIAHRPTQLSFDGFCSGNLSYYLREKFLRAKDAMKSDEWENVMKHAFENPVIVHEIRARLWSIAKAKREGLMLNMREKGFPLSRIPQADENGWSERISEILH